MSLLPNESQVNPSSAFWAPGVASGGGGGGGGGPDLVVSSIVVNSKTSSSGGAVAFSFDFPFDSAPVPAGMVGIQQGVVKDYTGGNTNAIMAATNNGGNGQTTDFAATRLIVGSQGTNNFAIAKPTIYEAAGYLMINPSISTPALVVSSINGLPPGGGSAISTFTTVSTQAIYASTIQGTTGIISLDPAGTDQIRIGGAGAPGDITLATVGGGNINLNGPTTTLGNILSIPNRANVSSLFASSINGAAYPPPLNAATKVGLANNIGQDITLPANAVPGTFTTMSGNYSVTAGSTYRVTCVLDLSGNATGGQVVIAVVGAGIGQLPELIYSAPVTDTVQGYALSCVFSPGNSGTVNIGGYNTSGDGVLVEVGFANFVFENLGAI